MTDVDGWLLERLETINPAPGRAGVDWQDVRERSHRHRRGYLPLAAALAAVVAVGTMATPLGSALAASVEDFSAWLRGEPGTPVSDEDQAAFARANARSYAGFPPDTRLRSLIETTVDGSRFELLGFRSGGSLCLRLVRRGAGEPQTGCVPAQHLETTTAPAVVVLADASFGRQDVPPTEDGYVPALASATFGLAADGVREVEVVDDGGRHTALLGGNAFLRLVARPHLGLRTRGVTAVGADGRRLTVPLAQSPFGTFGGPVAKPGVAPGPTGVDRSVLDSRIGWLDRREERGEEAPADANFMRGPMGRFDFARVLAPAPGSHKRILFAVGTLRYLGSIEAAPSFCVYLLSGGGAGGGCNSLDNAFPRGPLMTSLSQFGGGDQFATLSGAVSDEVASLELHLASSARVTVPVRDNAFLVEVPRTEFPARLVARDRVGRVIGNEAYANDPMARAGPQPVGPWRLVATAQAGGGDVARLRLARSSEGGTCYSVRITGGAGGSGCLPKNDSGPALQLSISSSGPSSDGGSSFLYGRVGGETVRLELRLRGGQSLPAEVHERYVLQALPAGATVLEAVGFDASGAVAGRQEFRQGRR